MTCDVYPYTAGSTQLLQIIPKMLQAGGLDATLDSLRDPAVRRKLDELFRIPSTEFDNFVEMEGWENISVSSVASGKNRDCVGKSMYAPIAVLIIQSFNQSKSRGHWGGFTLQWYQSLFTDADIGAAFRNTILLAVLSSAAAVILGTAACIAMPVIFATGLISSEETAS